MYSRYADFSIAQVTLRLLQKAGEEAGQDAEGSAGEGSCVAGTRRSEKRIAPRAIQRALAKDAELHQCLEAISNHAAAAAASAASTSAAGRAPWPPPAASAAAYHLLGRCVCVTANMVMNPP